MADLVRKNWQKDAGDTAVEAGIRAGGALATAFILNKFFSGEPKDGVTKEVSANTAKTLHNIAGPMFVGLGVLGDMMFSDSKLRSLCQGVTTYAVLHSIAVIAPSVGEATGVSGLDTPIKDARSARLFSGVGRLGNCKALGATSLNYNGSYPEELALAAGQKTTVDSDGKTYNNDWAYLAENIDKADQITKTVNGVADVAADPVAEEAAKLMGVDAPQASKLLGMF